GFAHVEQGELLVTHVGREFAETDILHAKELFREQVLANVPLVATIYQTLQQKDVMRSAPTFSSTFWMNIILQTKPCGSLKRQSIGDVTPSCLSMRQANADCLPQPTMMCVDVSR